MSLHVLILQGVLAVLAVAAFAAFLRLVIGPSVVDRIVAFDLITLVVMGIIVTYSVVADRFAFLDAVIILALVAFLATVAFARLLLRVGSEERRWPR